MRGRAESKLHATEKLGLMSKPVLVMAGRSRSADQAASSEHHQTVNQSDYARSGRSTVKHQLDLSLSVRQVPRDVAGVSRRAGDQCIQCGAPGIKRMWDEVDMFDGK